MVNTINEYITMGTNRNITIVVKACLRSERKKKVEIQLDYVQREFRVTGVQG